MSRPMRLWRSSRVTRGPTMAKGHCLQGRCSSMEADIGPMHTGNMVPNETTDRRHCRRRVWWTSGRRAPERPVSVVLIDRRNHHPSSPFYQAASAAPLRRIARPIRSILRTQRTQVLLDEVTAVDPAAKWSTFETTNHFATTGWSLYCWARLLRQRALGLVRAGAEVH